MDANDHQEENLTQKVEELRFNALTNNPQYGSLTPSPEPEQEKKKGNKKKVALLGLITLGLAALGGGAMIGGGVDLLSGGPQPGYTEDEVAARVAATITADENNVPDTPTPDVEDVTGLPITDPDICNMAAKPTSYNPLDPCNVLQQLNQALVANDSQAWDNLNSFWEPGIKAIEDYRQTHPNYGGEPFNHSYLDSINKELRENVFQGGDSISCSGMGAYVIDSVAEFEGPTLMAFYEARLDGQEVGVSIIHFNKIRLTPDNSRNYGDVQMPFSASEMGDDQLTEDQLWLDGAWYLDYLSGLDNMYLPDLDFLGGERPTQTLWRSDITAEHYSCEE